MNIKTIFFYIKFWKCLQLKIFIDLLAANGNVVETEATSVFLTHGLSIFYLSTISRFFSHSWLITGFVTRLQRGVPLIEQELLTLPWPHSLLKHLYSGRRLIGRVLGIPMLPLFLRHWRQVEHIRSHLWHRYAIAVNDVMVATVKFWSDDFNFTRRTLGSVASLLAANFYRGNLDRNPMLWNINWDHTDVASVSTTLPLAASKSMNIFNCRHFQNFI
jgi:hypothetical protein